MLPIDINEAFDDYDKSKRRFEMNNINDSSIEDLGKSRITINYNGPVMQFSQIEDKKKNAENSINKIGNFVRIAGKILATGTKLIGISAPVVAPMLLSSNRAKQILLGSIKDKEKIITIDKKSKEYFDSLKENDIFYLFYVNELNKTPLTDYLININEPIDIDKIMYFNKTNNFVLFFIKYLKRNNVMIKYFESKNKENDMIMEVEYLLYKYKKKLYMKINSYAIRKVAPNKQVEVEHIDDSKVEILHK